MTLRIVSSVLVGLCCLMAPLAGAQDPLPPRALQRLGTARFRHGGPILSLAFQPRGDRIAAGSAFDLRVWLVGSGQMALPARNEPSVFALVYTPSGKTLITAGAGRALRLWDTGNGEEIGKLEGHASLVKALAMSPEGSWLASGGMDGKVWIWELNARRKRVAFQGHADEITSLAFSPDGGFLASAGADRVINVWNLSVDKKLHRFDGGCSVQAVVFDETGKKLYSAGDDNVIRVWDVSAGKQVGRLEGHTDIIMSLALTPDGKTLVSGARDGTIRLWNPDGSARSVIQRSTGDSDAMAVSTDGKWLAAGGTNNTVRLFDLSTGKEQIPAPGPQAPLTGLARSSDGQRIFAASAAGHLYAAKASEIASSEDQPTPAGDAVVAVSPDGGTAAVGNTKLTVIETAGKERIELPVKEGDAVLALGFAPGGRLLAAGLRSQQLELWDWKAKKIERTLPATAPVAAIAFAPGGMMAVGAGSKIGLFENGQAQPIRQFDTKEMPPGTQPLVACLAFSPDGSALAAGCYDGVIRLYDVTTGKESRSYEGHLSVVYSLAFSRDGRLLVSGSFDRSVRIWEVCSAATIANFTGHAGPVQGICFSANDRTVFSASADTTCLAWDVTGLGQNLPKLALSDGDLQAAWLELANNDADKAYQAVWKLTASARESLPFMGKRVYLLDPDHVRKLFKDLDSDDYNTRSIAMRKIHGYGRWMEGRLREAIQTPPSLEAMRRSELLLKQLGADNALTLAQERLRMRRLHFILEQVADEESLRLFQTISDKGPEDDLREDARTALLRLKRRNGS